GDGWLLVTNRMAIRSSLVGRQPLVSQAQRCAMVYNGEVYNYAQLARDLLISGEELAEFGDGLVVLRAVALRGREAIGLLNGMFAAIWVNYGSGVGLAFRDRMGIKPLYYAMSSGMIYFASEIKALAPETSVKEIFEVMPGEVVEFAWGGEEPVRVVRRELFFRLDDVEIGRHAKSVKRLRKAIEKSVAECADHSGPIGVYLSGGVDSGSVYALSARDRSDVIGVTVGNEDSVDVVASGRLVEELGGTSVVGRLPSESELFGNVRDVIRIVESFEPNLVRQGSVQLSIAGLAASLGLRVILCGEGADELFCGYPEFAFAGEEWEKTRISFLADLRRTQLQRVDRFAMHFTTEVRVPYLANEVIQLAMEVRDIREFVAGGTKLMLREAMNGVVPEWVRLRPKVVLSEGAGLRGNNPV